MTDVTGSTPSSLNDDDDLSTASSLSGSSTGAGVGGGAETFGTTGGLGGSGESRTFTGGSTGGARSTADLKPGAQTLAQDAQSLLTQGAEVGRAKMDEARGWAAQQGETLKQRIVEKPVGSSVAVFAGGLILGLLLARR